MSAVYPRSSRYLRIFTIVNFISLSKLVHTGSFLIWSVFHVQLPSVPAVRFLDAPWAVSACGLSRRSVTSGLFRSELASLPGIADQSSDFQPSSKVGMFEPCWFIQAIVLLWIVFTDFVGRSPRMM